MTALNMKPLFFTTLIACMMSYSLYAGDANDILRRMDDVLFAPDDQKSTIEMVLIDRNGNERIREAEVWQKGTNMRLFRFTSPAAEAGIAFLSLPDDVMYLYMPAFGRERRIASHVKNQSFAGTDFSYEDLEAAKYTKRYTAVLLEEKQDTYILELTPLPNVRSDYSKVIAHINKKHHYPERMESYNRGGQKAKVADYAFEQKSGYWYMQQVHMTNLQRDHSTRMTFKSVEFDTGLDNSIFTVRNLTRF